ncbi:MAG: flagellar biosynthesis regulator FlaF [Deltaproteobacteria bacterium]|nr:flagellar biosynthesis regulator FlaF [Deltaproteobacteria bacterium]
MYKNPVEAYQDVEKATISGRETEARVLNKAAQKLKNCQDNWDAVDREEKLDEALRFNQRIWSIFQGELSRDVNPLPKQLRRDLLRLSAFIDRRIFETMAYPSAEKLTAVININNNIAAGLRASPE